MEESKRWNIVISENEGSYYIQEFLTDAELDSVDDSAELVKALLDGMCIRWHRKYGTQIEVIKAGEGVELIVQYKNA